MSSIILKPYRISEIDLDKIIYTEIKEGRNKKVIYLNYDNDSNNHLSFQTTSLVCLEGLKKKDGFYELDIPLFGSNVQKVNQLNDFLKELDKKIINDARKNSKKWFSGMRNITYKSVIRSSTNKSKEYSNGVLRIKISENSNNAPILIDGNGNNITIKDIKPNCNIKMILECYAIWITDNGFGLYLKPELMSFIEKKKLVKYEYQLLDDSEEENEPIEDVMDTEVNPTSQSAFIQDVLENFSDDETSQIELPENLKIIKNTIEEEENLIDKNMEINKKVSSETSDYNTEDNIQTYKNYSSEVNKILNHQLIGVNNELNNIDNTSSDELNDDIKDLKVISKNMLNQITESDVSKISLIDSDLNSSSSDEDFRKLKNIIKTNI
jgi:hypothetical protein